MAEIPGGDPLSSASSQPTESVGSGPTDVGGIRRTEGPSIGPVSLVALDGALGERSTPGFTPDSYYDNPVKEPFTKWYGQILENIDEVGLSTKQRFDESKDVDNKGQDPLSTRDYYLIFGDRSTDYFRHGMQIINQKKVFGEDSGVMDGLKDTPFENNDPVFFGFEIILDAVSSPLLNGSVEDFIDQYSNISEIATKKQVIQDFKRQLIKLFRTKGTPKFEDMPKVGMAIDPFDKSLGAGSPAGQKQRVEGGKKAYMSYYLKKVSGFENLVLANNPGTNKYLTEYRKDLIRMTFDEDVSLTLGTLAHLYRLLYWSKPNGKNLIPTNLLRFNCDIIVTECRKFNRTRKAIDTGNLEIIKENLSRHIYALRECQFYFDKPTHEIEINLESIQQFVGVDVTMDFKYVTTKFERWVPKDDFGQYVSYNAGALWKVGNKGARQSRKIEGSSPNTDAAVPKFYQIGTSHIPGNFIKKPAVFYDYPENGGINLFDKIKNRNPNDKNTDDSKKSDDSPVKEADQKVGGPEAGAKIENKDSQPNDDQAQQPSEKELRKQKFKKGLEAFKERSKKAGKQFLKNLAKTTEREVKRQVNIRLRLLATTLKRIREVVDNPPPPGQGYFDPPYNVYRTPRSETAHFFGFPPEPEWSGASPDQGGLGSGGFFDVRGSVVDFSGGAFGAQLGNIDDVLQNRSISSNRGPTEYFSPPSGTGNYPNSARG